MLYWTSCIAWYLWFSYLLSLSLNKITIRYVYLENSYVISNGSYWLMPKIRDKTKNKKIKVAVQIDV